MQIRKLTYFLSIFLIGLFLFSAFNNGSERGIKVGYNISLTDRDTNFTVSIGDTNRIIIDRANHNIIFGSTSVNPTEGLYATTYNGTGLATFKQCWINSTVGVTEDFYNEGTTKLNGYVTITDSLHAQEADFDSLTADVGNITTLSGTSASFSSIQTTDSIKTPIISSQAHILESKSGISINKGYACMYLKENLLIFLYRDAEGTAYYYFADLSSGTDITNLTYSLGEP